MNDDELRASLARRVSSQLTPDERNDLLRSARLAATEPRRRQPVLPRLAGLVAAIAAVLVLVIVALPIVLSAHRNSQPRRTRLLQCRRPLGPHLLRQSTAVSTEPPSPSVTPDGLAVYTAQELADKIGDPDWIGKAVLARASITELHLPVCPSPTYVRVRASWMA